MHRRSLWLFLAILWLAWLVPWPLAGQARAEGRAGAYSWDYIDVDITIQTNGDLEIVETHGYAFGEGAFTYAYRDIPLSRVEGIEDVWVVDEGQARLRTSTARSGSNLRITWWFAPTSGTRIFRLHYRARGAVRIYPEGDQLWWKAIFANRTEPVRAAHVTVHLPAPVSAEQLKIAAYGVPARHSLIGAETIWFTVGEVAPGQELEVRVQFPHGLVQAPAPAWQGEADRIAEYNERTRPAINLLVAAFSLFVLVLGCLGILALWYVKGRERPAGEVAEYLAEPPADLPPAMAGILLRERPDIRDIVATIVDLARRGVLEVHEQLGLRLFQPDMPPDFTFRLLRPDAPMRPYEATLLRWLFAGGRDRRLSDLGGKLERALPEIRDQMGREVAAAGYFVRNPEVVYLEYSVPGVLLAIVGLGLALFASGLLNFLPYRPIALLSMLIWGALHPYTDVGALPCAAVGAVGLALAVAGRYMPRRTPAGAAQAARWRAFRRYLAQIGRYTDLAAAREAFDRYLPYAIAFGLERAWIASFAAVGTPAPSWYVPFGAAGLAGAAGRPGLAAGYITPSLQNVSDGLARSLESMSAGLTSMLDATAGALSSGPAPGGGGGRGGWSGGGGRAGGGGGGGGGGAG